MNLRKNIINAMESISPFIRKTYFNYSLPFSQSLNNDIWFKLENLQYTGSFKVRGAFNKLLNMSIAEKNKGVLSASTGNHGAALAYASKALNLSCTIYVPTNASPTKLNNMKQLGAKIIFHGDDCVEAEKKARDISLLEKKVYISPYNDLNVVSGQGTIGCEIVSQIDTPLDVLIISVGGGGLISGIASYIKSMWPNIYVIGCSPKKSAVMLHSIKAGNILDLESEPTISDGTAGGVEDNSITFSLCQELIDESVFVTEIEIKNAMVEYMEKEHQLVEGAAGTAIAALKQKRKFLKGKRVGVVVCGGNISMDTLKGVI